MASSNARAKLHRSQVAVIKMRGQASVPGLHTFRITEAGLQAFSRTFGLIGHLKDHPASDAFPSAFLSSTRCSAAESVKATAS